VELLEACTDFQNVETNLQVIARTLGVLAERTPKFHCELAGKGIEYDWAYAKQVYRSKPITDKKGRQRFQGLVRQITRSFPKENAKRNSARARAYVSTYYNIHFEGGSLLKEEEVVLLTVTTAIASSSAAPQVVASLDEERAAAWRPAPGEVILYHLIQKGKKIYNSHRGVHSFEKGVHAFNYIGGRVG